MSLLRPIKNEKENPNSEERTRRRTVIMTLKTRLCAELHAKFDPAIIATSPSETHTRVEAFFHAGWEPIRSAENIALNEEEARYLHDSVLNELCDLLGIARFLGDGIQPNGDEYICRVCKANWSQGEWNLDCEECGGGALTKPCPWHKGQCGGVWQRAVLDSWDSGQAHWLMRCGYRQMQQETKPADG